jgi:hypothetical protein
MHTAELPMKTELCKNLHTKYVTHKISNTICLFGTAQMAGIYAAAQSATDLNWPCMEPTLTFLTIIKYTKQHLT